MRLPLPAGVFAFYGQNIMQTEAEVLTDHNELISSTSIERIVTGRDAALSLIEILIHNRHDVSIRFMDFVRDNPHQQIFEDELFTIRYFQKGSGHITFKRLDLVDKMNDIVAKHFPGMLPAK